jgi:hypothetical protein
VSEYLDWLEQSTLAASIRQSLWLYPALEIVHILGIVILVGSAWLFDLGLLGFSQKITIASLSHYLLPWSRRGLILIIPSGLLLFITNAGALGFDPIFWLKMALLTLAGLNAFLFHKFSSLRQNGSGLPPTYKIHALISILFWTGVISCGRLLAY